MHIVQVVSYLGAWTKFKNNHQAELSDIVAAANNYYTGKVKFEPGEERNALNFSL